MVYFQLSTSVVCGALKANHKPSLVFNLLAKFPSNTSMHGTVLVLCVLGEKSTDQAT